MLAWLRSLFPRRAAAAPPARPAPERSSPPSVEPPPALPAARGLGLDRDPGPGLGLQPREQQLLARVGLRVERRQIELPQLPSTSSGAIELCARPHVEIHEIVALVERDPVLTSELLRIANSVLYAGNEPATTLREAVLRVGLRTLRSMLYAVSVRGALLGDRSLSTYAEEVWRQSSSCAAIARALAKPLGMDPERAFLIGLLHDIGKLPLLAMLRKAATKESEVTPALVGRMFRLHHEEAGAALAQAWRMPDELVEVARRHHDFTRNDGHGRSAALASLAHQIDLDLSLGFEDEFRALVDAPELDYIGMAFERRPGILALAQAAYEGQQAEHAAH
jgi:putative nucleotidyltransferase with HDIG domain